MKKTKIVALSLVLALVLNMIMPFMTVVAITGYTITFEATGEHTLENDEGHLKIDGQYVDLVNDSNVNIGAVNYTDSKHASITVGDAALVGYLNYNTNQFTLYNTNGHVEYSMGTAISSNTVFMVEDYSAQSQFEDIMVNVTFVGTTGEISFNNGAGRTVEGASYNDTLANAGYIDNTNKNEITINTSFGEPVASKITINGVDYNTNNTYTNTLEVDGAPTYTIVVESDSNIETPKTIIWANPGATDIDAEDALIEHGNAKIIAVYDENDNKIDSKDYTNQQEQPDGSRSDEYGLNNGNGWAVVKPGYKVEFEFVPEYGYQLTKVMANEQTLAPQSTVNHYTFTMPDTNVHFAATFTKTEDIVKAESEKISSGEISLGNTLNGGTVQLTVSDVELSADKIKGFEGAVEGYNISNYLDIDLYNIFYKGKADSNDVWSNKIDELDKEATISLKLADGLTADDIVIVHNVHDGEEYEVIKIDSYDPETNTITFKTKSFSNYAIATKLVTTTEKATTTEEPASKNPKTGDNIILFIGLFVVATLGVFTTLKFNKNRRVRKH